MVLPYSPVVSACLLVELSSGISKVYSLAVLWSVLRPCSRHFLVKTCFNNVDLPLPGFPCIHNVFEVVSASQALYFSFSQSHSPVLLCPVDTPLTRSWNCGKYKDLRHSVAN